MHLSADLRIRSIFQFYLRSNNCTFVINLNSMIRELQMTDLQMKQEYLGTLSPILQSNTSALHGVACYSAAKTIQMIRHGSTSTKRSNGVSSFEINHNRFFKKYLIERAFSVFLKQKKIFSK